MQRYRVNYPLLIGLAVGFFVFSVGAYFLWRFQVDRNATSLLAKADAAEASGDVEGAFKSLDQYVQLRPHEPDARRRLGEAAVKLLDLEGIKQNDRSRAYSLVVEAVRETDDPKLRRKLVDVQLRFGMIDLASGNINQLLEQGHGDAELKSLKAQCLFSLQKQSEGEAWCYKLIGYDPKTDSFDAEKAEAADKPIPYAALAAYLHANRRPELALRVIEQMVAANPKSSDAYVTQYQFLKGTGDDEGAREALVVAYELAPEDAAVLTAKGAESLSDFQTEFVEAQGDDAKQRREDAKRHLAVAAKFFAQGMDKYPERIDFYERAARIEVFRENPDEAMVIVEKGLEKFPLRQKVNSSGIPLAIGLANIKTEILLAKKDFDGVNKIISALRGLNNANVNAVADYHEARMDAVEEKWADAIAKLRAVQPRLLGFPDLQAMAAAIQGFCQLQLGQFDLALEAYRVALEINPDLPQAKAGYDQARLLTNPSAVDEGELDLNREVKEILALPEEQRDWEELDKRIEAYIDEQAAGRIVPSAWAASRKPLVRGQVLAMRAVEETDPDAKMRLFVEARNAIKEAYAIDPKDLAIQLQAIRLLAHEPESGPAKALELLDSVVKKSKDSAAFRSLRVELLAMINDEQLPAQLEATTQDMNDFSDGEKAQVWSSVAARYEQLGKLADAQRCLEQAAALAPNSLPMRLALFDMALKQGDDPGMRVAQEKILQIVKNKTDPIYVLTEAKRRMIGFNSQSVTKEELAEAREMLNAAIKQRPNWSDLRIASGQLALLLDSDVEGALKSFESALDLGASNLNAIALQVRLLAERGRLQEARQRMDRIPASMWSTALDRTAADVLAAVGETDKAFAEAEKVAAAKPNDFQVQSWLADKALRAEKIEAAEAAMRKTLELNPEDPDAWTRLVGIYLQMKRPNDVERTLREAHLALDDEFLPLLTGKYYELQSRWQEAEDIYLSAYSGREDDPNVARRLAEFYLQWSNANEANRGKAAIYINRILRAANEGKLAADDPNAPWARRQAAKLLALNGDYQDSMKAERLLNVAIDAGVAVQEDYDQLVDLLSLRNDPGSRMRAVETLQKIKQEKGGLSTERELQLAHLLYDLGEWDSAKRQILDTIGRFPDDLRLQTAYASMLIGRKEFDEARLRMSRLDGNSELAASLNELRLRLAAASDDTDEVRRLLTAMTPNLNQLTAEQLKYVRQLVQNADAAGDHQYALTLMREYARRASDAPLELARLNALYGDLDEGLASLQSLASDNLDDSVRIVIEALRARRDEAPEKLDEAAGRLVRAALRDDPESARRLLFEAEMLEVQEKFDGSIVAYKKLLARDDVPKLIRATALNNLAFILALKSDDPADAELALDSVNEAIELIGPISDILDTRALALIKQEQYAAAAEDMKLAVKMNPTPSKYYHLAVALLGAGDEQGAAAAWKQAKAEGIGPEKVSAIERNDLEAFTKKMEAAGSTAQLYRPLRCQCA